MNKGRKQVNWVDKQKPEKDQQKKKTEKWKHRFYIEIWARGTFYISNKIYMTAKAFNFVIL